jgi:RNA polymerase sigma factor (sigma-70 family)
MSGLPSAQEETRHDDAHREELILSHMLQVKLLAHRLRWRCPQVEFGDLTSMGTIGLIQAVERFDPDRHLKLKTLAEHRIRGALLDYLRYIDPLPRSVRRFQKQRDAVIDEFFIVGKAPSGGFRCFDDEIYNALADVIEYADRKGEPQWKAPDKSVV